MGEESQLDLPNKNPKQKQYSGNRHKKLELRKTFEGISGKRRNKVSAQRDIETGLKVTEVKMENMLTLREMKYKQEQAGAELCQAQVKLE